MSPSNEGPSFISTVTIISRAGLSSYQGIAYEYAVEMTYPLPEATSAGLINVVSQVYIKYYSH